MTSRFSLRARLVLAVGAITLVALALADVAVYTGLHSYLFGQVDATLRTSQLAVERTVPRGQPQPGLPGSPPGSPDQGPASSFCDAGREHAPGMFIEVVGTAHHVVLPAGGNQGCPAYQPGNEAYAPELPAVIPGLSGSPSNSGAPAVYLTVASTSAGGPSFRVRASLLPDGDGNVLVVADPLGGVDSTLNQLLIDELLVTGAALIAAAALGLWLVRIGLRPLRDVERTADAIAGGDLLHRVPNANARTEVGRLATAFNVMLERIQTAFGELGASEQRLRRFVGDASHELRTPIAAVSAYAELFQRGAAARPEDLRRVMTGIERESARMARLVEDLLTLARLDEHRVKGTELVELVGLVAEAAEIARTVGPAWPITFVADEPIEVNGDRGALRQVVDNLLSNVRAHTPEGSRTTLAVRREAGEACIEVADDGPGITEEQAGMLFERFYRADSSRSRRTGGAGLGLAIVASIVSAHGGRVEARPRPGGGALFRVLLPAPGSADTD